MFYFFIVPAVRGKCQGFVLYRQTWQCNENITDCGGKRAVVLPTGCPRSAGLLAGICRTKVKVPAIPLGWGGVPWLQMTSALKHRLWVLVRTEAILTSAHDLNFWDVLTKTRKYFNIFFGQLSFSQQ